MAINLLPVQRAAPCLQIRAWRGPGGLSPTGEGLPSHPTMNPAYTYSLSMVYMCYQAHPQSLQGNHTTASNAMGSHLKSMR